MEAFLKPSLTQQEVEALEQSFTLRIADTPFKKLTKRDGLYYVYDEDGKIRKSTMWLDQALKAYNTL